MGLLQLELPWGLSPWTWSKAPDFAAEHEEGLHEVVQQPRSHTSKNCFIDTARWASRPLSGPVENAWDLWPFWPSSSRGHSRGNRKSRGEYGPSGGGQGGTALCWLLRWLDPPGRFWQILALAQGSRPPVSGVRVGPEAATPVSLLPLAWGDLPRCSLTSDSLGWRMPDLVVVWSCNQVARVLGSVGEK